MARETTVAKMEASRSVRAARINDSWAAVDIQVHYGGEDVRDSHGPHTNCNAMQVAGAGSCSKYSGGQ